MSWTAVPSDPRWPHHICVIAKIHVIEPFELPREDAADFFYDCTRAAEHLRAITDAAKINYEIHGNTIPHLHMHIFTRGAKTPHDRPDLMAALREALADDCPPA